jgi:hypothetical protein
LKKCLALLLSVALVSSCVSRRVDVEPVNTRTPVRVQSPVKAHLADGSTVVYPDGVEVTADAVLGRGSRYDVTLQTGTTVDSVPLADVLGMETYRTRVNATETTLLSAAVAAGAFVGAVILSVAIFGSCPTVYSSDGTVEEAELFSTSIAPLFEGRDVDRLRAAPDANGFVTLEVRNEAMETHYINHLELLEVPHAPGERVVPDHQGSPIVVGSFREPEAAVNRDGRDLRGIVAKADGVAYAADGQILARATTSDMDDWIDLSVPVTEGATEAAVVFRMRNSLLNTVLLYDVMLAPAGAASLDWLGEDLGRISSVVELGRWHQRRAGLHVSVWRDGAFRPAVRIPDSGPISWHDVAAVVAVPPGEKTLRVRLSYVTDHWRIDDLAVAFAVRKAVPRAIPVTGLTGASGTAEPAALLHVNTSDETYLQTNPGHTFRVHFNVGTATKAGTERTFLLSSQGYYTEWIRGSWIRNASASEPFMPNDAAVIAAMRKWSTTRDTFEQKFFASRVPVR